METNKTATSVKKPKNIVLCSDGTGNTGNKNRGTNVYKIFEAVDLNSFKKDPNVTEQIAFYDDGVGTESLKPLKLLGGAVGWGLSQNVKDLYKDLVRVYEPGDRIFLFGFSRGAFTVRTLAGFILACGVLDYNKYGNTVDIDNKVNEAYKAYRRNHRALLRKTWDTVTKKEGGAEPAARFRNEYAVRDTELAPDGKARIAFIGVWDTVDAVGFPIPWVASFMNRVFHQYKFSDCKLGEDVDQACHALAFDDERHTFHPYLWNQSKDEDKARIEQVWFSGVHANVGGGYPKQGMSLVSLDWMMDRAERAGLQFIQVDRDLYRERMNVDDKLYDSRSGPKVYYRYLPRNITKLCVENDVSPKVHVSAMWRISNATLGYAPGNYPKDAELVLTDPNDTSTADRLKEVQGIINKQIVNQGSPLKNAHRSIKIRRILHAAFVALSTLVAVLILVRYLFQSEESATLIGRNIPSLERYDPVFATLWAHPYIPILMVLIFVATYVERRRMQRTFSQFWHNLRKEIKKHLN